MRSVIIGGQRIADDAPAWVIAEIGNNHGGNVQTAHDLIAAAANCGVDAVKFQTRSNRDLYTAAMYDSAYASEAAYGPTYGAHREALELPLGAYADLRAHANDLGVQFLSTPFDYPSADFLVRLGVPALKVASGDLTNLPFILHLAHYGLPLIVSTGGATLADVDRVVDAVLPVNPQLVILQCTAAYPVRPEDMELNVITTYREEYPEVVVGLSDHFDGILSGPLAFMLGARCFEKHFTIHHTWKGTDHAFSLEPEGMRRFVRDLRRTPVMLGSGYKHPFESEAGGLRKMAKSLVAARDLPVGHVVTEYDVAAKSPGGGLPPYRLGELVGTVLDTAMRADEPFVRGGAA